MLLITRNSETPTTPSLRSRNFLEWLTELRETRYFLDQQFIIRDVSQEEPERGVSLSSAGAPLPQDPDMSTNLEAFLNPPSVLLQRPHDRGRMDEVTGMGD